MAACLTGQPLRRLIPERYWPPDPPPRPPTAAESERGWKALWAGLLGGPPPD